MTYVIRDATAHDAAIVMSLVRELAEFERLAHEVAGDEAMLRDALASGHSAALLAEENGEAIGFALFFYNFSTFLARRGLYLEDLYVKPAHRKRGVGRAMLRRLARLAVDNGCGRFEWAVLDWNENALRFYEGIGAKPIKEWIICRLTGEPLRALANEE
jgi:GNAT superfamily N-acetyltransferase